MIKEVSPKLKSFQGQKIWGITSRGFIQRVLTCEFASFSYHLVHVPLIVAFTTLGTCSWSSTFPTFVARCSYLWRIILFHFCIYDQRLTFANIWVGHPCNHNQGSAFEKANYLDILNHPFSAPNHICSIFLTSRSWIKLISKGFHNFFHG